MVPPVLFLTFLCSDCQSFTGNKTLAITGPVSPDRLASLQNSRKEDYPRSVATRIFVFTDVTTQDESYREERGPGSIRRNCEAAQWAAAILNSETRDSETPAASGFPRFDIPP